MFYYCKSQFKKTKQNVNEWFDEGSNSSANTYAILVAAYVFFKSFNFHFSLELECVLLEKNYQSR